MIFSELEAGLSLVERMLKKFRRHDTNQTNEQTEENKTLVSTRFVQVCEAHGIHRNQIPRVFGSDLTLYDVQSDIHLLKKMDDTLLIKASNLLGVKRDWLEGASEQIYETYNFYQEPQAFQTFLKELINRNENNISGVLLTPSRKEDCNSALLLIQETVGYLDGKPYLRYYLCNNWRYDYWKARGYLAACISYCWLNKIYVNGSDVQNEKIDSLSEGYEILDLNSDGIFNIRGMKWYAEDMALDPQVFLKGVDAEQDNYGLISGLELWLELESYGFMNCGINDKNTRQRFEGELQKYR